jgi:hypothetical protein
VTERSQFKTTISVAVSSINVSENERDTDHRRQYTSSFLHSEIQIVKGKDKITPLEGRFGPEGGQNVALLFHAIGSRMW